MTIPHLKQRAEFYALCLEHGEENVEWRLVANAWNNQSEWRSGDEPRWILGDEYEFRVRPSTVVIPEAVVPEEDPEGQCCIYIRTGHAKDAEEFLLKRFCYRTAADRDAVVAAMMRREKR